MMMISQWMVEVYLFCVIIISSLVFDQHIFLLRLFACYRSLDSSTEGIRRLRLRRKVFRWIWFPKFIWINDPIGRTIFRRPHRIHLEQSFNLFIGIKFTFTAQCKLHFKLTNSHKILEINQFNLPQITVLVAEIFLQQQQEPVKVCDMVMGSETGVEFK